MEMVQLTHALGFQVSTERHEKYSRRPLERERTNVAIEVDNTRAPIPSQSLHCRCREHCYLTGP